MVWWTYPLLPRLCDMLVRFEEGADVERLAAPEISVYCPVEGELEGAFVEVSVSGISMLPLARLDGVGRTAHGSSKPLLKRCIGQMAASKITLGPFCITSDTIPSTEDCGMADCWMC